MIDIINRQSGGLSGFWVMSEAGANSRTVQWAVLDGKKMNNTETSSVKIIGQAY
jgi:hypothetical protein